MASPKSNAPRYADLQPVGIFLTNLKLSSKFSQPSPFSKKTPKDWSNIPLIRHINQYNLENVERIAMINQAKEETTKFEELYERYVRNPLTKKRGKMASINAVAFNDIINKYHEMDYTLSENVLKNNIFHSTPLWMIEPKSIIDYFDNLSSTHFINNGQVEKKTNILRDKSIKYLHHTEKFTRKWLQSHEITGEISDAKSNHWILMQEEKLKQRLNAKKAQREINQNKKEINRTLETVRYEEEEAKKWSRTSRVGNWRKIKLNSKDRKKRTHSKWRDKKWNTAKIMEHKLDKASKDTFDDITWKKESKPTWNLLRQNSLQLGFNPNKGNGTEESPKIKSKTIKMPVIDTKSTGFQIQLKQNDEGQFPRKSSDIIDVLSPIQRNSNLKATFTGKNICKPWWNSVSANNIIQIYDKDETNKIDEEQEFKRDKLSPVKKVTIQEDEKEIDKVPREGRKLQKSSTQAEYKINPKSISNSKKRLTKIAFIKGSRANAIPNLGKTCLSIKKSIDFKNIKNTSFAEKTIKSYYIARKQDYKKWQKYEAKGFYTSLSNMKEKVLYMDISNTVTRFYNNNVPTKTVKSIVKEREWDEKISLFDTRWIKGLIASKLDEELQL